ncbi:unnamed protein product [Enterobius vermicularis]|uniref:Phospholipid-transporting ATPase n=1 Tax=Enterobius vermicularis TaxID=51028 RepID=A0A0N4VHR8_ENTVE|nr:unnamed protein product [Enterobius vermicularis]
MDIYRLISFFTIQSFYFTVSCSCNCSLEMAIINESFCLYKFHDNSVSVTHQTPCIIYQTEKYVMESLQSSGCENLSQKRKLLKYNSAKKSYIIAFIIVEELMVGFFGWWNGMKSETWLDSITLNSLILSRNQNDKSDSLPLLHRNFEKQLWKFYTPSCSTTNAAKSSDTSKSRKIHINPKKNNEKLASNAIRTFQYAAWSFIPLFLAGQFRRVSNIFFLFVALLQQIPGISPTGRWITAIPLSIMLSICALKELFEDFVRFCQLQSNLLYLKKFKKTQNLKRVIRVDTVHGPLIRRRISDKKVNSRLASVLRYSKWAKIKWEEIAVGDIVKVEEGMSFPADLLLLSSSEENGFCYTETSNIDGETYLKRRNGLENTSYLKDVTKLQEFYCEVECEQPNKFLNQFRGTLTVAGQKYSLVNLRVIQKLKSTKAVLYGIEHILLRGARLKHTEWIYGVVLYTGHETKLLLNSSAAPIKLSSFEKSLNEKMIYMFAAFITLVIISVVAANVWRPSAWLNLNIVTTSGNEKSVFYNVITFFILYNNLLPISLLATLEMIRFFQAWYINNDLEMCDDFSNTPAVARTSNLMEELGKVNFVMCDKTGTLTQNVMRLKKCSVAGIGYGSDETEEFDGSAITECLRKPQNTSSDYLKEFLRMLAICHTVTPEKRKDRKLVYHASSPDEGALVHAARNLKFVFCKREPGLVVVNELVEMHLTQDSVIYSRLNENSGFQKECKDYLQEYATKVNFDVQLSEQYK